MVGLTLQEICALFKARATVTARKIIVLYVKESQKLLSIKKVKYLYAPAKGMTERLFSSQLLFRKVTATPKSEIGPAP